MNSPDPVVEIVSAGRIVSMSERSVLAFAMRGDWIVAEGSVAELRTRYPSAPVHDFADCAVVPGFNDAHQHPSISAEQSLQVDLSPGSVVDTDAAVAALAARAAVTPAGEWLLAHSYDPFRRASGPEITRTVLDGACPEHPVLVTQSNLHIGVLNTRALELTPYRQRADAPGGGELGTDVEGRLDGLVYDQALYDVAYPAFTRRPTIVPAPDDAALRRAFSAHLAALHAVGLTSVTDALVAMPTWQMMRSLAEAGGLTMRINALVAYEHFDQFRALGADPPEPGARLRIGGVKAFADGAVSGGTCLVDEPAYGSRWHGLARVSPDELRAIVRDVHDARWRVCVHANGDRAIRMVLDAIESAQAASPAALPHRIEHVSIVDDDLVERIAQLGVIAVPFANYVLAHGQKLRSLYGERRAARMFAHRDLLDRGIPVAGSSDHPCGPLPPLFALQSCVQRRDEIGAPFGPEQRITPTEALGLYTTGAAYASGEQQTKGRLIRGQLADFVVLDGDPTSVGEDAIAQLGVQQTWVGGECVHSDNL